MSCARTAMVQQAQAWLGCRESDGSHKKIIDVYNSHSPKARGYTLKYTDPWCSGFVSACAIACHATDILPTEVGCGKHIALFQEMGIWQERDDHVPLPGDVIFYDWEDSGEGDNKGGANHVGIVEKVENNAITVIEGNYKNAVKRRVLQVDGKYIRGYGLPQYDDEGMAVTLPQLKYGSRGELVRIVQYLLLGLGYPVGEADGSFGPKTRAAVKAYQGDRGLEADGIIGPITWGSLLGVAG